MNAFQRQRNFYFVKRDLILTYKLFFYQTIIIIRYISFERYNVFILNGITVYTLDNVLLWIIREMISMPTLMFLDAGNGFLEQRSRNLQGGGRRRTASPWLYHHAAATQNQACSRYNHSHMEPFSDFNTGGLITSESLSHGLSGLTTVPSVFSSVSSVLSLLKLKLSWKSCAGSLLSSK